MRRLMLVVLVLAALGAGAQALWVRFGQGLAAATALGDPVPWGLWVGFDVLSGVGLAAGGFTLAALVRVFHVRRLEPLLRGALLTAFLGYLIIVGALLVDLGRPFRIAHVMFLWNPRSVMFEVGWCVILYTAVLAIEVSPLFLEKVGWRAPLKVLRSLEIAAAIAGVVLSILHQSSLGSLYLLVPGKLNVLWYSPLLPLLFVVSAVAMGGAMTILESFLGRRGLAGRREAEAASTLALVVAAALCVYMAMRVLDLAWRGALGPALDLTREGRWLLAEVVLGVAAPLLCLSIRRVRDTPPALALAAGLVVLGFVIHRWNVSVTGLERHAGVAYAPKATEVQVTLMLVVLGGAAWWLLCRWLPVHGGGERQAAPRPAAGPIAFTSCVAAGALCVSAWLVLTPAGEPAGDPGEGARLVARPPSAETIPLPFLRSLPLRRGPKSPGQAVFEHATHVEREKRACASCHPALFGMLRDGDAQEGQVKPALGALSSDAAPLGYHDARRCGACHDGKKAFGISSAARCATCHKRS